jgi:predicted DNA-binding protein
MASRTPRQAVTIYPDTGAAIERLMAKTNRRQSVIIKEALERGLRQMEYELEQIEHIAQRGY